MMRRVLESLFARKLLFALPAVAAVVATTGFLLLQPASYQSTATLWVNGGNVGTQSPAQTQTDVINQYLKTDSFAMAVADASPLHAYLNANPAASEGLGFRSLIGGHGAAPSADSIRTYLAAHVSVAALGPSEIALSVIAPTASVARGTADALIAQLGAAELAAKIAATQTQLQLYETQLQQQAAVVSADLLAVRNYLAAHPALASGGSATTDGQLALLQDRATVDQQTYVQLLSKIQQAQSDLALAQQPKLQPFRVVDAPQTPQAQSVFGKQQLIALAAALVGGLLAVAAVGALVVRLDTTIHTESEIEPMLRLSAIGSTPLTTEG